MAGGPSVQASASGTTLLVQAGGDMGYETAPFFRDHLLGGILRGQRWVVLDLSAVSFCDSSGLSALLGVTGMDTALQVYGTLAEAKDKLVVGGEA
ncbi:STAS domain-containing protein [Streptomyces sp. NPDC014623]|uniref:STAS domain-containing protein n=1 Tax=Streptomyces sp. NPDC014623 TaxID=3364875 RepID=UPI0036FE55CD